jgi:AAA ATPase domain
MLMPPLYSPSGRRARIDTGSGPLPACSDEKSRNVTQIFEGANSRNEEDSELSYRSLHGRFKLDRHRFQICYSTMELLEREELFDELEGILEAVTAGSGCIVLVSGQAGIGKTTLVERDLPRGITQGPEYSAAHAMRCLRRDRSVRYMTSLHKLKASCLRCSNNRLRGQNLPVGNHF